MTSYIYDTITDSVTTSAVIQTDKVRIATLDAVMYAVGFPNTSGTGNIITTTDSITITGDATIFTTQLGKGYWIGDSTGNTIGIVNSIANNTSLTLTANAAIEVTDDVFTYSPYGVPYVDDVLDDTDTRSSGIIPANTTLNSVIVGQGNVVTFISRSGSNSQISITELGMPHANTGTTGF